MVLSMQQWIGSGRAVITVLGAVLVLAGCETTSNDISAGGQAGSAFGQMQQTSYGDNSVVTTNSRIDPATGQREITGGTFIFGSGNVAATMPMGTWTLGDDFARRCTLSFTTTPLGGSAGAMSVNKTGFCSNEFSNVAGWMAAGTGIALTDASGRIQGQLAANGHDAYNGTINTMFGSSAVRMSRGGF